jgi:hypothetical protein
LGVERLFSRQQQRIVYIPQSKLLVCVEQLGKVDPTVEAAEACRRLDALLATLYSSSAHTHAALM